MSGNLITIEEPKESDIWIVSIYPGSFRQWLLENKESIETSLEKIGQKLPCFEQLPKA